MFQISPGAGIINSPKWRLSEKELNLVSWDINNLFKPLKTQKYHRNCKAIFTENLGKMIKDESLSAIFAQEWMEKIIKYSFL